jgi:hypothetical protein
MKDSNKEKNIQLGMPLGTASARLKKAIMLNLLQKLCQDICYKCGERITTPEELSVDHKVNWLYNDTELFWDLNNIAFSHRRCNISERRGRGLKYKYAPEGKTWCSGCQEYLDISLFHKDNSNRRGFQTYCKECRSKNMGV